MTVLENLLVAQHNVLNAASGYTFGGLLACRATPAPRSKR